MEITRRDIAILMSFSALLVATAALYYRHATSAPAQDDGAAVHRPTRDDSEGGEVAAVEVIPRTVPTDDGFLQTALAPGAIPDEYEVILERKLFEPLIRVQSKASQPAREKLPPIPAVSVPGPGQSAVEEAKSHSSEGSQPSNAPQAQPSPPPKPPLAVTGLLRRSDGYRVVIENMERHQTRVVKVGEEAFGYRVMEVAEDSGKVLLEAQGDTPTRQLELKLGDKRTAGDKKEEQPDSGAEKPGGEEAEKPKETPPPTRLGPPRRSFDPSQLTPEQRRRWEEWRRRRQQRGGRPGPRPN